MKLSQYYLFLFIILFLEFVTYANKYKKSYVTFATQSSGSFVVEVAVHQILGFVVSSFPQHTSA